MPLEAIDRPLEPEPRAAGDKQRGGGEQQAPPKRAGRPSQRQVWRQQPAPGPAIGAVIAQGAVLRRPVVPGVRQQRANQQDPRDQAAPAVLCHGVAGGGAGIDGRKLAGWPTIDRKQ